MTRPPAGPPIAPGAGPGARARRSAPERAAPLPGPPALVARPPALRRRLLRVYDRLHRRYGAQRWWPARSRFEVVVGAILTQNAAWRNVEAAIGRLRAAGALHPAALRALPRRRLEALVRPSGTFRVKAARLHAFVRHLARHHDGRLGRLLAMPLAELRAELLGVPGIGRETADAIALYAAGRPVFVVDAYTRRILGRHGLIPAPADYDAVQARVMAHLPHDPALFNEYHALLVRAAKEHCRVQPRCAGCPLHGDLGGRPPRPLAPPRARSRAPGGRGAPRTGPATAPEPPA